MKASTVIHIRRRLGNWIGYALPPEPDDDGRRIPDPPPPPEQIPLPGMWNLAGERAGATNCKKSEHSAKTMA